MKLNKKHLPFYAAFVQTAQYSLAGWLFMGWIGAVCVGLMGSLISLSMAYATSQYSDIAQKRKGGALVFLVILMSFSPILIGTATFIHLEQVTNLIWRGVVCAVWGILPDGATALAGFIAGKGLVEQGEKQTKQPKAKSKAKISAQDIALPAFKCATCSFEAKSQKALNGHQLKHKPIAYTVNMEPVTKEQVKQ
jgi:MFS family permease